MSEQNAALNTVKRTTTGQQSAHVHLDIRRSRYDDRDYEAAVAIENANYPEHPQDAQSWRYWDSNREAKYLYRRYLGEINGKIVATADLGHTSWSYQPGKYYVFVAVEPANQGRGIGHAFYNYLLDELALLQPVKLVSRAREDHAHSVRFLQRRGFKAVMRMPTSRLDVITFDPQPFQHKLDRVLNSGIVIKTMAQLRREDPDWKRKIYDLEWECLQDVPTTDPLTRRSLEQFERMTLNHPRLLDDAWFIAVDGQRYVGLSVLWYNPNNRRLLETGLTGVVRSHRRRGIATAMKLQAIDYARAQGAEQIDTDNEENNPMFQINIQLGFKPQPAFVEFQNQFLPAV